MLNSECTWYTHCVVTPSQFTNLINVFKLHPHKSFHCPVWEPLLLCPSYSFTWLTETLYHLLHNESVCNTVWVCVWRTASISAGQIVLWAESWIRLSKPCGFGRRHALNRILSYRLCLPNLYHVTWEVIECLFLSLTQRAIQFSVFLSLSTGLLPGKTIIARS